MALIKRMLQPQWLLVEAVLLLYLCSFWTLGTSLHRIGVEQAHIKTAMRAQYLRVVERWTRADMTLWIQELSKLNPHLSVPPVPPGKDLPALPGLSAVPPAPDLPAHLGGTP